MLWVDRNAEIAAFIDVLSDKAWPVLRPLDEFEEMLERGSIEVGEDDPYAASPSPEGAAQAELLTDRDKAWNATAYLIEDPLRRIFHRDQKGRLVAEAAEQAGVSRATIYRYLRRYWQGGQVKNALLPRYDRQGGKGKPRVPGVRKRGRPRKGEDEETRIGINITKEVLDKLRRGWQKYYLGKKNKRSLKEAYDLTMAEFFADEYERIDGQKIAKWYTWDNKPTFGQFKSHYYREKRGDFETFTIRDVGEAAFGRDYRPVLGSSSQAAFGSGAYLQVDCTPCDIYQVNSLDRSRNIGRGTLYTATDAFAHYCGEIKKFFTNKKDLY